MTETYCTQYDGNSSAIVLGFNCNRFIWILLFSDKRFGLINIFTLSWDFIYNFRRSLLISPKKCVPGAFVCCMCLQRDYIGGACKFVQLLDLFVVEQKIFVVTFQFEGHTKIYDL